MSTSAKRLSLSNPIVIAVVLVLLAVVTVVNIKTFAPKRRTIRRDTGAAAEHSSVPLDLEQVVRRAATAGPVGAGAGGGMTAPTLDRDPFARPRRPASGTVPVAAPSTDPVRANPDTLVCAAVLPGGNPVARINGRTLKVGDVIRGWRLAGVETGGVRLARSDGRELFLTVSSGRESNKSYRMVTGVQDQEDPGRTVLDEETERRTP